jgi:hypothetical protein
MTRSASRAHRGALLRCRAPARVDQRREAHHADRRAHTVVERFDAVVAQERLHHARCGSGRVRALELQAGRFGTEPATGLAPVRQAIDIISIC